MSVRMSQRAICTLVVLFTACRISPVRAADPSMHPLPSQAFGDWLAACDNLGDCAVYGFGSGDGAATMIVSLPRGAPPAMTVVLQPNAERPSAVRLQNSHRGPAVTISLNASGPDILQGTLRGTLSAGEVAALLPTLRPAGRLILSQPPLRAGGRAAILGTIRLAGAAPALDWVAARQRTLPEMPSFPASLPLFDGSRPDPRHLPRAVTMLPAVRACQREDAGDASASDGSDGAGGTGVTVWRLGPSVALWSIPCGSGNFDRETLFVLAGPHATAATASFTTLMQMAPHPPGMLVNAETAPDGRDITATAPDRGLGDCGDYRSYRWDGTRFRLVLARLMTVCRGLAVEDWPIVYRGQK